MSTESTAAQDEGRSYALLAAGLAVTVSLVATIAAVVIARLVKGRSTHVALEITIDRPTDEVFDFVSDARNVVRWMPSAIERNKVTPGPVGLGTRYEGADRIGSRRIEHTQEIIEFEPGRVVTTQVSEPWNGTYQIRTAEAEDGTLLSIDVKARASGLMGAFDIVPDSIIRRTFEADYRRLKDHLENPDPDLAAIAIERDAESIDIESEPAAVTLD